MTEHWIETYKSLITLSVECFKFLALINGGAIVALLTYTGNISNKSNQIVDVSYPMHWFLVGLILCGISMLFGYLTQLKLFNELGQNITVISHAHFLWIAFLLLAEAFLLLGWVLGQLLIILVT